jgi:4-hydroxybenzoate polyprenyltransferase
MSTLKVLRKVVDFVLFSNIFLSLSVTSLVFETDFILSQPIQNLTYPLFLFSATLFLYCFHRVYSFNFNSSPAHLTERHLWVRNNKLLFYCILVSSALATLFSVVFLVPFRIFISLLPVGLISLGYTVPCIPWKGKLIRLRDLPGIKIFLISLVLGLTTVLLPVLATDSFLVLPRTLLYFVFLRRIFFIFAITIPFDIRDMEYDRQSGTMTIPLLLGVPKSRNMALLALTLFMLSGIFQYFYFGNIGLPYLLALILSAMVSGWVIMRSQKSRPDYYYSFYLEGMMLLQCLLIFAGNRFLK